MNMWKINRYPWPKNLITIVRGERIYKDAMEDLHPDYMEALTYILEQTLTDQESAILYAFYRDRQTLQAISEHHGLSVYKCRQIIQKAIQKIRHPKRMILLLHGLQVNN